MRPISTKKPYLYLQVVLYFLLSAMIISCTEYQVQEQYDVITLNEHASKLVNKEVKVTGFFLGVNSGIYQSSDFKSKYLTIEYFNVWDTTVDGAIYLSECSGHMVLMNGIVKYSEKHNTYGLDDIKRIEFLNGDVCYEPVAEITK